jgi:hypothetical protein
MSIKTYTGMVYPRPPPPPPRSTHDRKPHIQQHTRKKNRKGTPPPPPPPLIQNSREQVTKQRKEYFCLKNSAWRYKTGNPQNKYFIASVSSIIIGFLTYYFFRESNILIYKWLQFLPRNNNIITFSNDFFWLDFLRFNLPDGLLLLSGILFLRALWYEKPETFQIYKICFLIAVFLLEILQIFREIPGTFDFFDLLTMGSITLLESIVHKILITRRRSCVKK